MAMTLVCAPKKRTSRTTTEDSNPTDLPKPPKKRERVSNSNFRTFLAFLMRFIFLMKAEMDGFGRDWQMGTSQSHASFFQEISSAVNAPSSVPSIWSFKPHPCVLASPRLTYLEVSSQWIISGDARSILLMLALRPVGMLNLLTTSLSIVDFLRWYGGPSWSVSDVVGSFPIVDVNCLKLGGWRLV